MEKPVVVLVDLQHDFVDLRFVGIGKTKKAVGLPGARQLVKVARERGWPVVHVVTEHTGRESLPALLQRRAVEPYCVVGTPGADIINGLYAPGDDVVKKQGFNGFGGTNLAEVLQGADEIVLAGIATDCCVSSTALDAGGTYRKNVYIPYQAVAASSREMYEVGLAQISKSAGSIVDLTDVVAGTSPLSKLAEVNNPTYMGWWHGVAVKADGAEDEYLRLLKQGGGYDVALAVLEQRLGSPV